MVKELSSSAILEKLKEMVMICDAEGAKSWARTAVAKGIDPVEASSMLTDAIRQIGDAFGREELFLPDLIGAADAMKSAMSIIQEEITRRGMGQATIDSIVIGTVKGDIHDIGKTMVSTLLAAAGFEVIDLGVDISAEKFIETVRKYKPRILALSALLTTTAPEQRKIIEVLSKEGLREKVKVMVGGGAITKDFADSIGADGYDPTAVGGTKLAKKLIGK